MLKQTSMVVNNYEIGDCTKLESFFTLFDKNTFEKYIYGMEYDEEKRRLILPRGLDISYVEDITNRVAMYDKKHDPFDIIEPLRMKLAPRDDIQKQTIKFLVGVDEYDYTSGYSQLGLSLNTGAGKTYCSTAYLSLIKHRGIIISTSNSIISQWEERLMQYTNIKKSEILFIKGSYTCSKILNDKIDISKIKVILCTHSTLRSYASQFGWDKIGEIFKKLRVGTKIYDECHKDFLNLYKIDYNTNTYKTIYISATLNRSCVYEDEVYQLYFKNVPVINLFNPEIHNRTKYLAIKYDSLPSAKDRQYVYDYKYGINRLRYIDYITNNTQFYQMCHYIINFIYKKTKDNEKALIYIGTNEAIERFYRWFVENFPSRYNDIGVFTSIMSNNKKYQELNKKIILSTTKSAGEGIDIQGLKISVVLAEPFKSKVIAKQSLGRTRDNDTLYIELVDISISKLKEYYDFKKSVFSEHATECYETSFDRNKVEAITPVKDLILWKEDNEAIKENLSTIFKPEDEEDNKQELFKWKDV